MLPLSVHYTGTGEEDDGEMMEGRTGQERDREMARKRRRWTERRIKTVRKRNDTIKDGGV